jgi:hypothetical protein
MSMNKTKMKHCAYCGDEIDMTESWDREPEPCGKPECNREVRDMYRAERDEAHEQLDRDMGYF